MRRPLKIAIAGAAVIALAAGGTSIAMASIPSHHGTITGCYSANTGALRIVKSKSDCKHSENVLQWSQHGGQGARGPKGVAGARGPAGAAGVQGLAGDTGVAGAAGTAGAAGADGKTVLNDSGAPGSGVGEVGDFYIDTTANEIYGPKTGGGWGGGTSLVGPAGPADVTTASGSVDTTGYTGGEWSSTAAVDSDNGHVQAFMACAAGSTGWLGVAGPMFQSLNLIGTNGTVIEADSMQIRVAPPSGSSTLITAQVMVSDGSEMTLTGSYTYSGSICTAMLQVYTNNP